jgi:hypothetical protein
MYLDNDTTVPLGDVRRVDDDHRVYERRPRKSAALRAALALNLAEGSARAFYEPAWKAFVYLSVFFDRLEALFRDGLGLLRLEKHDRGNENLLPGLDKSAPERRPMVPS